MTRRTEPIAVADDARARLAELEDRHLAALDGCGHGPSPAALDHARRFAEAAEVQADAAERIAREVEHA